MELRLEKCTIRNWCFDDAESLAEHADNRRAWLGLRDAFPHPYKIEDANEFLRRAIAKSADTSLCIDIQGCAVGGIGITIGQDVHRHVAELGYWLGERFWGRGVMTEAVSAFISHCFTQFSLRRTYAEPFANNPASARVLEKAGFIFEGRLRNNTVKDEQILDSLLYAKTM